MSTSRVFTVGQVLTAAQMNDLPQGHLGDAASTADVGPTSGTTELTILTTVAINIAGSNRIIKVSLTGRGITSDTTGDTYEIHLKDGTTIIGGGSYTAPGISIQNLDIWGIFAPAAGSHTLSASIVRTNGVGTATVRGTASIPLRLLVEDIGI